MDELKPCPFCGGKATIRYYYEWNKYVGHIPIFYVQCTICGFNTTDTGIEEKTIEAWNRMDEDANTDY